MNTKINIKINTNYMICIAEVVKVIGLNGIVKIKSFLEDHNNLLRYQCFLENELHIQITYASLVKHDPSGDLIKIKITGIENRDNAEKLLGKKIFINRNELTEITAHNTKADKEIDKELAYYHVDLIGCEVFYNKDYECNNESFDASFKDASSIAHLGRVTHIHNFGNGDMLEIDGYDCMIPFLEESILRVDVKEKRILVAKSFAI